MEIKNYQDGFMLVFSALTQGVLIAGASVYVNQLIKQTAKQEEGTDVQGKADPK